MFCRKYLIILFTFLYLIPLGKVFGATLFMEADSLGKIDSPFSVSVYVDTKKDSLNAFSGEIMFDNQKLLLESVNISNSMVNFWIEQPKKVNENKLIFEGITPGGVLGEKVFLFKIIFKPITSGDTLIYFNKSQILKNDGDGSEAQVSLENLKLEIGNIKELEYKEEDDNEMPEIFKPEIAKNDEIFEGKYFVVFYTQDKKSGVQKYEIKEGFWDDYKVANSPYVLVNQDLSKKIYIKATDFSGNSRIVSFYPKENKYQKYLILFIIVFVSCLTGFYLYKLWKRRYF